MGQIFSMNYCLGFKISAKQMSRFWGYSKRPKDWKNILRHSQENDDEDKPINDKPITVNKPITANKPLEHKPVVKPRIIIPDSSVSNL